MKPYGLALLDYHRGNLDSTFTICRDDGYVDELPAKTFFRQAQEWEIERIALDLCHGHVLDVGAGTGIHSLFLQEKGLKVCAIDVSPEVVLIMRERGVIDVRQDDIVSFENGWFDTILMMGHGIGVVEHIDGLNLFFNHIVKLLKPTSQILLTSVDVRTTNNKIHRAYHEQNRKAGRYFGEVRIRFQYKDNQGPFCGWLHIDPETLGNYASRTNLSCEVVKREDDDNYLARLLPIKADT